MWRDRFNTTGSELRLMEGMTGHKLVISVHTYPGYSRTTWFITCEDLGIPRTQLPPEVTDMDQAKAAGLALAVERLRQLNEVMRPFTAGT